jgi:hypothetical protein
VDKLSKARNKKAAAPGGKKQAKGKRKPILMFPMMTAKQ